jgi:hypothetical protein
MTDIRSVPGYSILIGLVTNLEASKIVAENGFAILCYFQAGVLGVVERNSCCGRD